LANDESLRQRLGSAGRHLVEAEFSSARIGAEIVTLYRRMLGASRSGLPQSPATAS
jgi:hypothetical protein